VANTGCNIACGKNKADKSEEEDIHMAEGTDEQIWNKVGAVWLGRSSTGAREAGRVMD
jgi:hypothetical protein